MESLFSPLIVFSGSLISFFHLAHSIDFFSNHNLQIRSQSQS